VPTLRNNIIANFGGQAMTVLLGIAFMPVYIRILGIEAYGLIGFFLSLQALFAILDMGLSATLNRELARYSHSGGSPEQKRDLVRTLEWVYWPIGFFIAAAVLLLSQPIAYHWLKPVDFSLAQTASAIALMGLATALQWPTALYGGGFRGLERQVALNAINVSFAVLRAFGAVGVLVYLSPTLEAFLWWQVVIAALQTAVCRFGLWHMLPAGARPALFQREILRRLRGFTIGMTGIAALSFMLMQSDRIILSTVLSLDTFGFYTVAATVAGALSSMVGPFFNALFPRYSGLVSTGSEGALIDLYHETNQYLAVVVVSVAAVLAFFSIDVLLLWTQDRDLAARSGPIMSLLVTGTALNGLMHLPYALQLAHGWTRLALYQNIASVLFVVPATWWAAHHYGGLGAASVWVVLNLSYVLIAIPLMHRRLLRTEMANWYLKDILPPVCAALAVAGIARVALGPLDDGRRGLLALGLISLTTIGASALSSSFVRRRLRQFMTHAAFPQ